MGLSVCVDLYAAHLVITEVAPSEITSGRAGALIAAGVGLISVIVGGMALARSIGRLGSGTGRVGSIVVLVLGVIGVILSVAHLAGSTGFGTGGGRLGAIVGLVLGLIGAVLGGLAFVRTRSTQVTEQE